MKSQLAVLVAVLALTGCTAGDAQENIVTTHRPVKAERATLQVGEDCTLNGESGCVTGVCIHVVADPHTGYFCTTPCQTASQCPGGWICGRIPGTYSSYCVPPEGRTSSAAQR